MILAVKTTPGWPTWYIIGAIFNVNELINKWSKDLEIPWLTEKQWNKVQRLFGLVCLLWTPVDRYGMSLRELKESFYRLTKMDMAEIHANLEHFPSFVGGPNFYKIFAFENTICASDSLTLFGYIRQPHKEKSWVCEAECQALQCGTKTVFGGNLHKCTISFSELQKIKPNKTILQETFNDLGIFYSWYCDTEQFNTFRPLKPRTIVFDQLKSVGKIIIAADGFVVDMQILKLATKPTIVSPPLRTSTCLTPPKTLIPQPAIVTRTQHTNQAMQQTTQHPVAMTNTPIPNDV